MYENPDICLLTEDVSICCAELTHLFLGTLRESAPPVWSCTTYKTVLARLRAKNRFGVCADHKSIVSCVELFFDEHLLVNIVDHLAIELLAYTQ